MGLAFGLYFYLFAETFFWTTLSSMSQKYIYINEGDELVSSTSITPLLNLFQVLELLPKKRL